MTNHAHGARSSYHYAAVTCLGRRLVREYKLDWRSRVARTWATIRQALLLISLSDHDIRAVPDVVRSRPVVSERYVTFDGHALLTTHSGQVAYAKPLACHD